MSQSLWANLKKHKHTVLVTQVLPACRDLIATFQEARELLDVQFTPSLYTLKLLQNVTYTYCIACRT